MTLVPSLSAKHTALGLPTAVAGNACTSCPAFATLHSVTVRFACATAKSEPSYDHAAATGADERYESEARHCQAPSAPAEADEGPQSLMRPSVEVVRSKGDEAEGENAIEVIGASCGRSMRVDNTKLNNFRGQFRIGTGRNGETHPGWPSRFLQNLSCLTLA